MDAYDRCSNLGEKNLADSVVIYGRGRERFRAPTKNICTLYLYLNTYNWTFNELIYYLFTIFIYFDAE
jgi:hypothetical protein